jgi:D-alanyl-D-alanine carboxypeptidase (penicillin-binding protein 5/6)
VKTLVVLAVLVLLGGSAVAAARATATLPLAKVSQSVPSARLVGGSEHPLSWPTGVQAALAVPSLGVSRESGPERPAPVASLTKMMTAHIVLADHPLTPTQDGPSITITPDDVAQEVEDENTDQANIQVATGEVLTERQMLEGMLIHSANNFADLLADWDAGSIPAFVMKMNAAARSLGMTQTTYTDASGFSTQTVSTPADQLKLASVLIQNPAVAQIIDNTSVTLPVAGTVVSYTPLIGVDDVVGVKSGFTSAAGGCDVLALSERVDGVPVEVLAAVTGYQGSGSVLAGAGLEALSVARQAIAQLDNVQVLRAGEQVAVARSAGYSAPVVARSGMSVLVWPGQQITERLTVDRPPPSGAKAGWRVGVIAAQVGVQEQTVTVATSRALPSPSFFQRVF